MPGTYYEKMKSAWKKLEVKDLILPGTCYEKMKSAWGLGKCGSKGTFFGQTLFMTR